MESSTTSAPSITRLAVGPADAFKLAGISPSHGFAMQRAGKWGPKPIRLGRSKRFLVAEISAWLAAGAPPRAKWETMRGAK